MRRRWARGSTQPSTAVRRLAQRPALAACRGTHSTEPGTRPEPLLYQGQPSPHCSGRRRQDGRSTPPPCRVSMGQWSLLPLLLLLLLLLGRRGGGSSPGPTPSTAQIPLPTVPQLPLPRHGAGAGYACLPAEEGAAASLPLAAAAATHHPSGCPGPWEGSVFGRRYSCCQELPGLLLRERGQEVPLLLLMMCSRSGLLRSLHSRLLRWSRRPAEHTTERSTKARGGWLTSGVGTNKQASREASQMKKTASCYEIKSLPAASAPALPRHPAAD